MKLAYLNDVTKYSLRFPRLLRMAVTLPTFLGIATKRSKAGCSKAKLLTKKRTCS